MFLIDNLLLAPGKALFYLLEEMARKAREEWLDDDSVKQELQEIYAMLEAGNLSEQEFEAREVRLVERLQQIARAKLQENGGSSEGALQAMLSPHDAAPADDGVEQPAVQSPDVLPAEPEPAEAPARRELSFSSIAASLAPLLELAGARGTHPPAEIEAAMRVQPLTGAGGFVHADLRAAPIDRAPYLPATPVPPPEAPPLPAVQTLMHHAAAPASSGLPQLPIGQVIDGALKGLAVLQLKVSSVTAVAHTEDGWRVSAELVERRGVPDTSDFLGLYELRLDHAGNVLQWQRTSMRRRGDLGR
jgi:hypothetical protein